MKAKFKMFQKALDEFMKNEYWRMVYTDAPDGAKEALEFRFYAAENDGIDGKKIIELCKELKLSEMTKEDLEYLYSISGNTPASSYFKEMIDSFDK